jgi:adenylosuccinate synthase
MLDMDHGVFPHVTHANTTTKNAHDVLDKLGVTDRHVYYITRCYSTRHGSGPFPDEKLDLVNTEEEINVFNEFQKEFKTASINYNMLNQALAFDSIYTNKNVKSKNLVVTCLDQIPNFEFDYDQLNTTFSSIYESRSPKSENFLKKV